MIAQNNFRLTIIHPTARTRPPYPSFPTGWREAFEAWRDTAAIPAEVQYILVVHQDRWADFWLSQGGGIPEGDVVTQVRASGPSYGEFLIVKNHGEVETYVSAVNTGAQYARGRILVISMDDLFPPQGWDEQLWAALHGGEGAHVLQCPTTRPRDFAFFTPQILTLERYRQVGYVFYPELLSMYADNEFGAQAQFDGCVVQSSIKFDHRHFETGASQRDEVYDWENREEAYRVGKEIFDRRQREREATRTSPKLPIVALAAPGEHFSLAWVGQLWEMWCGLMAAGYGVSLYQGYTTYVHVTRQNIARAILATDPKPGLVFWMDDDNLNGWAILTQLLALLESRPDVGMVAGYYLVKGPGGRVCTAVGRWLEATEDHNAGFQLLRESELPAEPFEADAVGFGCVLMRVEVLEQLGRRAFSVMADSTSEYGFMGEDFAFCLAALRAGIKLVVDPRISVPHLKLQPLQSVSEVAV